MRQPSHVGAIPDFKHWHISLSVYIYSIKKCMHGYISCIRHTCNTHIPFMHLHQLVMVCDVLKSVEKPAINIGQVVKPVYRVTGCQGGSQNKYATIGRLSELLHEQTALSVK